MSSRMAGRRIRPRTPSVPSDRAQAGSVMPGIARSLAGGRSALAGAPLQPQPLLRPEAAAVVAPALFGQLVAHAGGVVAVVEAGAAEQQVPQREQGGEVVAAQAAALAGL